MEKPKHFFFFFFSPEGLRDSHPRRWVPIVNQTPTSKNRATRGTLTKGKNPKDCTARPQGGTRDMGFREGKALTKGEPKAGGVTPQATQKKPDKRKATPGPDGKKDLGNRTRPPPSPSLRQGRSNKGHRTALPLILAKLSGPSKAASPAGREHPTGRLPRAFSGPGAARAFSGPKQK